MKSITTVKANDMNKICTDVLAVLQGMHYRYT